jgi:hypothetical protein
MRGSDAISQRLDGEKQTMSGGNYRRENPGPAGEAIAERAGRVTRRITLGGARLGRLQKPA